MSRVVRLPAPHTRQPHLGGAEEQRVDLVEVTVVTLEDVVERRPVVLGRRGRDLGRELGELRIVGAHRVARLAAVQDAVVGAADGPDVVLRDGRERRRADAAQYLRHVEAQRVHLVQPGLEDAGGDLHAAGEARGGGHHEGQLRRREPRLLPDPGGHLVRGRGPGLEHQHAALRPFRIAEFGEQLFLDPRMRTQRPGPHREVLSHLDRPPGVLGRHTADCGVVRPHAHAGPRIAADRDRRGGHHGEASPPELPPGPPPAPPPPRLYAGVPDPPAPPQRPPRRADPRGAPVHPPARAPPPPRRTPPAPRAAPPPPPRRRRPRAGGPRRGTRPAGRGPARRRRWPPSGHADRPAPRTWRPPGGAPPAARSRARLPP